MADIGYILATVVCAALFGEFVVPRIRARMKSWKRAEDGAETTSAFIVWRMTITIIGFTVYVFYVFGKFYLGGADDISARLDALHRQTGAFGAVIFALSSVCLLMGWGSYRAGRKRGHAGLLRNGIQGMIFGGTCGILSALLYTAVFVTGVPIPV